MNDVVKLCEDNMGLVYWAVQRMRIPPWLYEEAISAAGLGLYRAACGFDAGRGFKFTTYATHCIYSHLHRLLRVEGRKRERVVSATDLTEEGSVLDVIGEHDEKPVDAKGVTKILLAILDERERDIVTRRYMYRRCQTLQTIANRYGLCKERIRQIEKKALVKMRAVAEQESNDVQS